MTREEKTDECRRVVKKMYLLLEGEGSEAVCNSLRVHLDQCKPCAERYKILEELASLCQAFAPESIPEDQKKRMKESLLKALSR